MLSFALLAAAVQQWLFWLLAGSMAYRIAPAGVAFCSGQQSGRQHSNQLWQLGFPDNHVRPS